MSEEIIENIDTDYEVIDFSRVVDIAKGVITENITEAEMEYAKVLMIGYQMGVQDTVNHIEAKVEASINDMKNNAAGNNEVNVEVDINET